MNAVRSVHMLAGLSGLAVVGCTTVGPDFERPDSAPAPAWVLPLGPSIRTSDPSTRWWETFNDPILNTLVEEARAQNLSLETVALRVLEARASLALAIGLRYPQAQAASGEALYVSPAESDVLDFLGIGDFTQYSLGVTLSWEADFWGRYRRSIEAADAAFQASIAAYDQAIVLLTGQVVDAYVAVRETQQQLEISRENMALQQRSYEITAVRFRNGDESELDMQQARAQLLGTQSTIPTIEAASQQALNALSNLLGREPGYIDELLSPQRGIPIAREDVAIGLPADLLRRRPDLRRAEYLAMAQSAAVGVATADLYPSFQLAGTLGTSAGGVGDSGLGDLFRGSSLAGTIGGSFVWPFLNYGRIRNNIRIEDARLQQALVAYRDLALRAAREAEDAIANLIGTRAQAAILEDAVTTSRRAHDLSMLQFREGFSDFQRVLESQQRLFAQEQRYAVNQADRARNIVALYAALGGGWEGRQALPPIDAATIAELRERTNWGELLDIYSE